ncbi:MAG TPA: Lsr2 family protein [Dermatophilaceae bacterium]|nr:Lsr2 family protein [Dermatophilaceae bacterium]
MAKRTVVVLEDDLDGSPADETVTFGLDGVSYEIDLSAANAAALRESLARWTGVAERVGGRRSVKRRPGGAAKRGNGAMVREWARANGHDVSDRGRVPSSVQAAYDKAHA